MKVFNFLSILSFAGSITALALPAHSTHPSTWHAISENEHGTIYSSLQAKKRDQPTWHHIGENEQGAIYSSVAPKKREPSPWHQIGENHLGPVYSNIKRNVVPR
jgi:hypothetical protein